ncbi:hypothetical protein D7D52_25310 [Nocardia yunnanensis]|uniref:NAD(+)--protein-arginine ADP-ribosyltransferase n=1 Tax=Nocardia yunnanensis TaxID=2382165 RepID=A0A386ZG62_9NOCA|nr:ADP-ribosyltransferase domain-containing protein [Nocardia yunnanensis]AYF76581.1 hypothetical protein D7D52_25310 [Nocardia yunnanensis]
MSGWTWAGDHLPGWLMTGLNFMSAYPKGDQDALFDLGDAWKKAASDLENLEPDIKSVTGRLPQYYNSDGATQVSQELATLFDGKDTSIQKLVESLNQLGHDTRATATEIEYTKIQSEIFALLTLYTILQLSVTLLGEALVPGVMATARESLELFSEAAMERIGLLRARAAMQTLAKPLVRQITVPLEKLAAPLAERLAEKPLLNAGLKYGVKSVVSGLGAGVMGAGLDAGTQAIQIMEGHRDDGFDLKQTFQTSIQWGVGGAVGAPFHAKLGDMLKDTRLPSRLGGTIAGGVGGGIGAVGMYGAGLATQLYDNKGDWNKVDKTFHTQMLIGGLAMGAGGGANHGLENGHGSPSEGPATTKEVPDGSAAVRSPTPEVNVADVQPNHGVQQEVHPTAQTDQVLSHEGVDNSTGGRAAAPAADTPRSDLKANTPTGADSTVRPTEAGPKPTENIAKAADPAAQRSSTPAQPAGESPARATNLPAENRGNVVSGSQDRAAPVGRTIEAKPVEVTSDAQNRAAPADPASRPEQTPTGKLDDRTDPTGKSSGSDKSRVDPTSDRTRPEDSTPPSRQPDEAPKEADHPQEPKQQLPNEVQRESQHPVDRRADGNGAVPEAHPDSSTPAHNEIAPVAVLTPMTGEPASPARPRGALPEQHTADLANQRTPQDQRARIPEDARTRSSDEARSRADDTSKPPAEQDPNPTSTDPAKTAPDKVDWSPQPDDQWSGMDSRQVADELADRWGLEVLGFDTEHLDPEVAREFARTIDEMLTRYPDVDLRSVSIERLSEPGATGDEPGIYAEATSNIDASGRMYTEKVALDLDYALNVDRLVEDITDDVAHGHLVPGSAERPIHSTLVHEFGHVLDYEGQEHAFQTAEDALIDHFQATRGDMDPADFPGAFKDWLEQLSGYSFEEDGTFEPGEALAEAFLEVEYHGDAASEPAQVLHSHLIESARGHGGSTDGHGSPTRDADHAPRPRTGESPSTASPSADKPHPEELHPRASNSPSPEPSGDHPIEAESAENPPAQGHPVGVDWSSHLEDDWSHLDAQEVAQELERRWEDKGLVVEGFDREGLHPEVAREYARTVDKMLSRYPDVDLSKVVIEPLPEDFYAATRSEELPDGSVRTGELILNERYALDPAEMQRKVAENEAEGHFGPGSSDRPIYSSMVHEFGHAIFLEGQEHASETAWAALKNHFESTRGGMDPAEFKEWVDKLSGYSFDEGRFDPDEALAEAFADVELNGEAATEPAKVLYWHLLDNANAHSLATHGFTRVPDDVIGRPTKPEPSAVHNFGGPDHSITALPTELTPEQRDGFNDLRDRATEIFHAYSDPARADELAGLRAQFAERFDSLGLRDPETGSAVWKAFHEHDPALAKYMEDSTQYLLPTGEEAPVHGQSHPKTESQEPVSDHGQPVADPDRPTTLTEHLKDRFEQVEQQIRDLVAAYNDPARAPELPGLRTKFGDLFDQLGFRDPESWKTPWRLLNEHDAGLAKYIEQNHQHLLPKPTDQVEPHVAPGTEPVDHSAGQQPQAEQPHTQEPAGTHETQHHDEHDALPHNDIPESEPESLTVEEHEALHRYTDPDANVFSDLNHRLRNNLELDPDQQRLAADISSGLEKLPSFDGTVWRGTHLSPEELARYVPGAKVTEPSFTSSSRDPRRIFTSNVEFVIHSESGRDISAISARPGEKEVLFKPDTTFEVRGVVHDPNAGLLGRTRVYLYESAEHAPMHESPSDHTGHEGQPSDHSSAPGAEIPQPQELAVLHGPDRTAVGDSPEVRRVYDNVRNEGEHDVVVHGDRFGKPTAEGGFEIDPQQIVDAIRNNPNYVEGTPVRLLSCHSGNDIGWAQHVADELGVPVRAPSDLVGVRAVPDSPAVVHDTGEWRTFHPTEPDGTTPEPTVHRPTDQPEDRLPKYEEDPRENWDILGKKEPSEDPTPPTDRTEEDKPPVEPTEEDPNTSNSSEAKPAAPKEEPESAQPAPAEHPAERPTVEEKPEPHPIEADRTTTDEQHSEQPLHQDHSADPKQSGDVEPKPHPDDQPDRKNEEQPRSSEEHQTEHARVDADEPHDPVHDPEARPEPIPLTAAEIELDHGIPEVNQQKFQDYGDEHDLLIEVRPTNPDSVPHLRDGAMPKPMEVKDKTIDQDDVDLGAPEWAKGLVGRFEPGMLKLPEEGTVSPERMEQLKDRLAKRNKDFEAYSEYMKKLGARFRVTEDGIVQGFFKGKYRSIAGDHDLFDIRHSDGSRLTAEELRIHEDALIELDAGVQHGPHVYWEPNSEFQRTRNFEPIIDNHQFDAPPGPKKEPLVQFRPHEQPVLEWAGKDVPGVDREMIPWHVDGKLDELHAKQLQALDSDIKNRFNETHPDANPDERTRYAAEQHQKLESDTTRLRDMVDELANHPDFNPEAYRALVNPGFKTPIDVLIDGHRVPMLFIDRGEGFEPVLTRIDSPEHQLATLRKEIEAGIKDASHPSDVLRAHENRPGPEANAPLAESPEAAKALGLDKHLPGYRPEMLDGSDGGPDAEGTARTGPGPELTPKQQAQHWQHLDQVESRHPNEFDHLQRDPDKNGGISEPSKDEARVGLDLREQGRLPEDIQRPDQADRGEFHSKSAQKYYDIKGVHSDWPPFNNARDKSRPFKGAYDPAKNSRWVEKLREQIEEKNRTVIIDLRNANQAAIDDIQQIIQTHGWDDDVIWYP